MTYFLWHDAGEIPVSMLTERDGFDDEAGALAAAQAFLAKWKRRFPQA